MYRWDATGNEAPVRVITGPRTELGHLVGIAVDPVRNLMAVANSEDILIFNRTDNGDVAPRARIAGPKTGITDEPWQLRARCLEVRQLFGQGEVLRRFHRTHSRVPLETSSSPRMPPGSPGFKKS